MPEGMTATIGPDGVRRETKFQYEYAKPPDQDGMSGIDLNAVQENIKNFGTDEAMKAVSAAIQFQGLRGYQQALNSGEPAEKAIAKYGPMMFYRAPQAFAPSIKALTPAVARPESPLARERFEFQKKQPIHVGQALYKMDETGKPIELVAPPEKTIPFAISKDLLGKDKTVRLTPKQFSEQMSSLPPYAQTNAANLAQLRAAGFTNAAPKSAPTATAPQPKRFKSEDEARSSGATAGDIIYLQGIGKVRLK